MRLLVFTFVVLSVTGCNEERIELGKEGLTSQFQHNYSATKKKTNETPAPTDIWKTQGVFAPLMKRDEYMIPITRLPDESSTMVESEIAGVARQAIYESFVLVQDIEQPIVFQGKTVARATCLVMNQPCWVYLILNEDGHWGVVSITTTRPSDAVNQIKGNSPALPG